MKVRRFIALFFLIWGCTDQSNSDQAKTDFVITTSRIGQAQLFNLRSRLLQQRDSIIFEDSMYTVRSTCHGEWGGSIWFTNKTTGIEYSCSATCPVIVNKIAGNYYVTTTLDHTEIIQIPNPDLMEVFEIPEPRETDEKGSPVYYVTDLESQSRKGTISLIDTMGIMTLSSFTYNDEFYHITTDFKSTFVSSIQNGKLSVIDTVSTSSIWTHKPEVLTLENERLLTFFSNDSVIGYVEIWGNQIDLKILKKDDDQ